MRWLGRALPVAGLARVSARVTAYGDANLGGQILENEDDERTPGSSGVATVDLK